MAWLLNIDTLQFKTYYSKKAIPTALLKYIEVDKLKEIANPNKEFASGCIRRHGVPHIRLNWIAKDKQNHIIASISFGGKGRITNFYYLDNDNNKTTTNINELSFDGGYTEITALTLGTTVTRIKAGQFKFEEYEEPESDED
ncbi:MAG TPA: hypothetical protein VN698_05525 [Bacteroidia bacterium]|nr:hypothetical protein [Bacteroidia bacterium]